MSGRAGRGERSEQVADHVVPFDPVAHRTIEDDVVPVASTLTVSSDAPGGFEIVHDSLYCSLGDADLVGEVTQAQPWITGQADQDVGVVGEERPVALVDPVTHDRILRTGLHELDFRNSCTASAPVWQADAVTTYEQLFENNRRWVASELEADPDHFERLAEGQSPDYLFIGCSDSRVNANEMVGTLTGQMFIHRNIANLVVHTDMNLMSVLQYAVEVLEVEHVIVCGHYGCGGVAAAVDGSYHGLIDKWLRTIKDVYRIYHEELDAIDDPVLRHQRLVDLNVREQVYRLCSTSFVQRRWGASMVDHVHGWAYDLRRGLLKDLLIDPADQPARSIYELDGL